MSLFVCLVEEIEVLTEVEAVCEELDVLCDGVRNVFFWFNSQPSWFFRVFNPGKYCLSFNWIENKLSDTGIWFLHRWIIRGRDESVRLMVWYIFFWFNFLDLFFFQEILTIFRWSHVRLPTIGALRMVITIEALVVFLWTLKASYWIRDIWTDFNIVKAHADWW